MNPKLFTNFILIALLAALVTAAFPAPVRAAAAHDDPQPGKGNDRVARLEKRLELAFARMQVLYERQTNLLDRADEIIRKTEALIAKANEKGLDAAAVEKALADFRAALPAARAAHNQAGAIIAAHKGFDEQGKVTDAAAAGETLKALHASFKAYRMALDGSGKALREAIRQFIEANRGSFKPGDLP